LAICRIHNATLIIAKFDRLSRNVHFISGLMDSGVDFVACDFPQANRLTVHILAAVAEHEAAMISQRTTHALACSKKQLGGNRGKITPEQIARANKASADTRSANSRKRAADLLPVIRSIQAEGAVSLREVAQVMNERGIPAARGGEWSAMQVNRIMAMDTN
jgi:DNA invertase Pin-like site-specific DNA recombinase